ncbi:MAG: BREX-4 system phosphatase PglZ, partial [Selenomonadaceae bacterium]|nr:BREX-4 system phosphatase PglZ [Selenomonadaceae bacterium]
AQWQKVLSGDKTWSRYLRGFDEGFANEYEQFAFEQSANFEEFERNIFHALLKVNPSLREFDKLYRSRKSLVAGDEKYLSSYIEAAKALGTDGLHYLTDNTLLEFRAAIELVEFAANRSVLEKNFPAARKYLEDYDFGDERLTKYFRRYKELKLLNIISEEFLLQVAQNSTTRIYNEQETRQAVLEQTGGGKLYWLDGLSVDFLSYIKLRLSEMGFRAKIRTARAELPTLTSVNKNFYEEWPWEKFPKNERLDKLRHGTRKVMVYFCDELFIIDEALNEMTSALKSGETSKVILTSDHGSSRGAVICRGQTIKLQSTGEHGGRCCKIDERDAKPNCAVAANGYYSLTNYDRIQGGRLESVEMHGGATLEEVLVPVIEIFM